MAVDVPPEEGYAQGLAEAWDDIDGRSRGGEEGTRTGDAVVQEIVCVREETHGRMLRKDHEATHQGGSIATKETGNT